MVHVPNGIENRPFKYDEIIKKRDIQVLFLSNLDPYKGPLEVLKAANIIVKQNSMVRFILAGAGSSDQFTNTLKGYINDNRLDEYVKMPGCIFGKEKEDLLSSSDIFVFPSKYKNETFGIVNVEAMRSGLPVISSAEGAIPEIVQDTVTGFIVDPNSPQEIADKVLLLINNPDLRERMGNKGREVFETKYTLEAYAKNIDKSIQYFLNKL